MLCVGTRFSTLRVAQTGAERLGRRSHGNRGFEIQNMKLFTKLRIQYCSDFESKSANLRGPPKNNKTNPFPRNSNTDISLQGNFLFSMWITRHLLYITDGETERCARTAVTSTERSPRSGLRPLLAMTIKSHYWKTPFNVIARSPPWRTTWQSLRR